MGNKHPNAGPGTGPVEIGVLAGGVKVIGHDVDYGAESATILYKDTDGNISVNLPAAAARPAAVLGQLEAAMTKAGTSHPAPSVLVGKILEAAGVRR